jgi:hypothetical protein
LPSQSRSLQPFFKRDRGQLFLEVVAKNAAPLLFNLRAATLGTLHLALSMLGKSQNCGEFLFTGFTEIFVLGHRTSSAPRFSPEWYVPSLVYFRLWTRFLSPRFAFVADGLAGLV